MKGAGLYLTFLPIFPIDSYIKGRKLGVLVFRGWKVNIERGCEERKLIDDVLKGAELNSTYLSIIFINRILR